MKDQSYTTTIEVAAAPQDVFERISQIPEWWTRDFEGNSTKLNDEFVICHPGAHYSKQQLTEFIPGRKVVWLVTESELSWLEKDKAEWTGTKMVFELASEGDKTRINFTHEGLVPEKASYERCTQGWNTVIRYRLLNFIINKKVMYTVTIGVSKSPGEVFGHLIHDIPKFWPEEFEGKSDKLNDEFIFRSGEGDTHYSKNLVTELVPDKKVVWLVTESIRKTDNFDWTGTKMIFELTAKGDNTLLTFTYDGFVRANEYERLVQICDMVIKENLYNFLIH